MRLSRYRRMRDAWEASLVVVVGDLPTSRGIINLDWGPRLDSPRSKYIRRGRRLHAYARFALTLRWEKSPSSWCLNWTLFAAILFLSSSFSSCSSSSASFDQPALVSERTFMNIDRALRSRFFRVPEDRAAGFFFSRPSPRVCAYATMDNAW